MIKDYFVLAFRNLGRRKIRNFMTILGILISVATIFMLVSISLGLQGAVEEQFKALGTDKIFIQPGTSLLGPPGSVGGNILTEKDVDTISKVQGVKDYSYFAVGNAQLEFSGEKVFLPAWGVPTDHQKVYEESQSFQVVDGKSLEDENENSVLVGWLFSQGKIFKKEIRPGNKLIINGEKFKVRGVLDRVGNPQDDSIIMMDMSSLRRLFEIPERVDFIFIQIEEGFDINGISDRIEKKLLRSRGQTEDTKDFDILKPDDLLESFGNILDIITVFLTGVAAISLLVGGIGIANTMYTSVVERTREIGVMKAIGARNEDIFYIFLIESGLLGVAGAALGVLFGYGMSKGIEALAVNQLNTTLLQTSAPIYLIFGCLAFGFIIGSVSGALPARQASKINVVDSLRYE